MPRTELPSGGWIEWHDKVMAEVRFNTKAAVVHRTVVSGDGKNREIVQQSDGANDDRMRVALWGHIITAWSFADQGIPIPASNLAGADAVWNALDLDDFAAFAEATDDLYDKVTAIPTRGRNAKGSSTT